MAATKGEGKQSLKARSNGSTAAKAPPEQETAGLWRLFPLVAVAIGIVVGILWEPSTPAAGETAGEAMADSAKTNGAVIVCVFHMFFTNSTTGIRACLRNNLLLL